MCGIIGYVGADEVVEEAVAFGAPVLVEGHVTGDAVSFGDDVLIRPTGVVDGDAVSFGGRVVLEDGAELKGDRVALAGQDIPSSPSGLASLGERGSHWLRDVVRRLVILLCLAGTGVLVVGLFPDRVQNVSRALELRPVRYSLAGMLLNGAGLLAASIMAITLIGLPVTVGLLLLLGLAWLLGFVALCQTAGHLLPLPQRLRSRMGTFMAGVLFVSALIMVPVLGKLLLAFSLLPCTGAAVATRFGESAPSPSRS